MHRLPISAGLVLLALASGGERIAAVYKEGAELACAETNSLTLDQGAASVFFDDTELPPEAVEEMGLEFPSSREGESILWKDVVLATVDGRPTRLRRTFERLRQHSVEQGEEKDKTGPLEGRTLVLVEEDEGEVVAELEGDGEKVEEVFLAGHRLTHDADHFLPGGEVAVGDEWQVEGEALREFLNLDSKLVLFEEDEEADDDLFDELFEQGLTLTAAVEFVEIEERESLRCAVLAITIEVQVAVDDPAALGFELEEGMEDVTGGVELEVRGEGKLWYALAEGRPVAMEQTLEGTMAFRFGARMETEEGDFQMKIEMAAAVGGESTTTWSPPE